MMIAMQAAALLFLALGLAPAGAGLDEVPPVESPVPTEVQAKFRLSPFYRQSVMVGPFPVLASEEVDPRALREAAYLIQRMIGHRPEVLEALAASRTRFSVMADTEMTTDVPEHADLDPRGYWDRRARGLGATRSRPSVSCGEENLLCFEGDPYRTENILIHEFAHAIHEMGMNRVDPTFDARLLDAFDQAMDEELWINTYAASNHREYWAELVQSYFDTNREDDSLHNHVDTRGELAAYDSRGHALCVEIFGANPWKYRRPADREDGAAGTGHLKGWMPDEGPRFAWPEDVIIAWNEHQAGTLKLRPRKNESALDHLRRRADAGEVDALVEMGWKHREGVGVDQSDVEAVRYYRLAADKGDPAGQDSLAWMMKFGRGIDQDDVRALELFRRSAESGHSQAMYNLALMLEAGRGVSGPDLDEAAEWLRQAVAKGHVAAGDALARIGN